MKKIKTYILFLTGAASLGAILSLKKRQEGFLYLSTPFLPGYCYISCGVGVATTNLLVAETSYYSYGYATITEQESKFCQKKYYLCEPETLTR